MSFFSRLLGYATKEEAAGATLDDGERWVIPATRDAARVLRSLPILFPADAFVYFEGTTDGAFSEWLATHSVPPPLKVAYGTIWPKPDFYHVPLRSELLEEAANVVERRRIEHPSIHLHVHDGARVLLEWHDAFSDDPMYVAGGVPREPVEEFARVLGVGDVRHVTGAAAEGAPRRT